MLFNKLTSAFHVPVLLLIMNFVLQLVHALACTIEFWEFGEHERSLRVERGDSRGQLWLLYNIAGGIVHQIGREKRTTISKVIVRGKQDIKQNRN